MAKRNPNKLTLMRTLVFFFNVFLALIIASSSYFIISSDIGKFSLLLGVSMLSLSIFLRVVKQW